MVYDKLTYIIQILAALLGIVATCRSYVGEVKYVSTRKKTIRDNSVHRQCMYFYIQLITVAYNTRALFIVHVRKRAVIVLCRG